MAQHFPPRGLPVQQHNIMGQPFIELRHRAAESRPRLPFPPGPMPGGSMNPNLQAQKLQGFPGVADARFPLNQGLRMADPMGGQAGHVPLSASMDNLHQQAQLAANSTLKQSPLMRSMSQPASNVTQNMAAAPMMLAPPPAGQAEAASVAGSEAVEEKLDAEESAVKDLEDVEVKDLVDADLENLNLDPDDGKDLDLETNDLHLDDFLTSGKFDIIAYTDPDLDDLKKDMFNEELDLSDPMDDNTDAVDGNRSSGTGPEATASSEPKAEAEQPDVKLDAPGGQDAACQEIKTEVKDCQKADVLEQQAGNSMAASQQGVLSDSTPVLSSLLIKQQPEEHSLNPIVESVNQGANLLAQQNPVGPDAQHNPGLAMTQTLPDAAAGGDASMAAFGAEHLEQGGVGSAQQAQQLSQALGQHRPLLLEEQPLLLQDLLDQERQEQQQQRQMQAMIRQRSSDSFFPNIGKAPRPPLPVVSTGRCLSKAIHSDSCVCDISDFDAITDPIMKAKMVALKGINKVMVQNNMGMTPMVMNRSVFALVRQH